MNVNLPEFLYKFLPLNTLFDVTITDKNGKKRPKNGFDALEEILVNNRIFYSKAESFNDPFEFDGVRLRAHKDDEKGEVGCKLLKRCGIISFSSQNENILMWSHYADSHRGVALRFRGEPDHFYSEGNQGRVIRVTYGNKIIEKSNTVFSDHNGIFEKMSRKACCWKYEQEYRVFKVPSTFHSDDATGIHPFNSRLIDAIFLGLRVGEEEQDKIVELAKFASHKIDLYKSIKNISNLKLDFEKI
jgi:hypothetical protein